MSLPHGDYGKELILDLYDCNAKFSKEKLQDYFDILCDKIKMEKESTYFWEYPGSALNTEAPLAHLKGISAIQFIKTSSIVVHTVDELQKIHINIFSCKDFDSEIATDFTIDYFAGKVNQKLVCRRI